MIVDPDNFFIIKDRDVGLDFAVPVFQSKASKFGPNAPIALDLMPLGNPSDFGENGVAWIDICNRDMLVNPNVPVSCARVGVDYAGNIYIGQKTFNGGATKEIRFLVGNSIKAVLSTEGLEVFGKVKAQSFVGAPVPPPSDPDDEWDFVFNGSNYEVVTGRASGSSGFTYEMYVKSTQVTRADILTQGSGYNNSGWHGLLFNVGGSGKISWYEKTNAVMSANVPWNDGAEHHVAISRSGNTLRMFFDGVQVATSSTSFSYTSPSGMVLGKPIYDGSLGFVGCVDAYSFENSCKYASNFTPEERG